MQVCSDEGAICGFFHSEAAARAWKMSYIFLTMSGWGCRYQIDEQCLLLRKECKPGMPGCVLYKKVAFLSQAEPVSRQKPRQHTSPAKKSPRHAKRKAARKRPAR
jgi:hypothetical protein